MPDDVEVGQGAVIAFRSLTQEFFPSAVRLSTQAGWNQTEEDWRRLLRLQPDGVRVWIDEGEVRASYSLISYDGALVWIGMILVDETYRGRGLGKETFRAALEHARDLGEILGLDATDLGKPIYLKNGFGVSQEIVRWGGSLNKTAGRAGENLRMGWHEGIAELDRKCAGYDRSRLLADFSRSGGTIVSCGEAGETSGFLVFRPGRSAFHIGPIVAESMEDYGVLLDFAATQLQGQPVICDANSLEAGRALAERGLRPMRNLVRMTLPESPGCLCAEALRCGSGLELG